MPTVREVSATPADAGRRLDSVLAERLELSRAEAERLLDEGCVTLSAGKPKKNYRLLGNEQIRVCLPDPVPADAAPENIPLDIVYEDAHIVVVNKPSGMVVHPAPGNEGGTLVNALLYHCGDSLSGIGGVERPGIVHRIDKDTSGLLVVAKQDGAHRFLAEEIKRHAVRRRYEAIALGNFKEDAGTVNAPIGRHPVDRKRMAIVRRAGEGREAITHFRVMERFGGFTHLSCELETGRTHQIRVHMASLGHPLLGDPVYGGDGTRFEATHRKLICGQCLHAAELCLTHPKTGQEMRFFVEPPAEFLKILELLRQQS